MHNFTRSCMIKEPFKMPRQSNIFYVIEYKKVHEYGSRLHTVDHHYEMATCQVWIQYQRNDHNYLKRLSQHSSFFLIKHPCEAEFFFTYCNQNNITQETECRRQENQLRSFKPEVKRDFQKYKTMPFFYFFRKDFSFKKKIL